MRLAPEVQAAAKIRWQLFLTLTWSGQVPRPDKRVRALRLFLRKTSALARVPFGNLVWFCREEGGEIGDRPHFHCLIAGLPSAALGFDFGFRLSQAWVHGFSTGRLWVEGLGALDYSCEQGANIYEGRKFRSNQPIMFSESLARVVGLATGDNVEKEDAKHSDNPEETLCWRSVDTGLDHPQPFEVPVMDKDCQKGHLAAVNVSRTGVQCIFLADITGAL